MSIISIPFTFSAGAVIVASQHNSCFSTIFSDYNGNIDNTNIVNAAGIVASKLDLTSPGGIGTTAAAAGKFTTLEATSTLKLASTHQGDILYDNGTSLVRLTPGTSGQFLKTLGNAANPAWATITVLSNILFQYDAIVPGDITLGTGIGEIVGSSANPVTGGTYRFLAYRGTNATSTPVWKTKFTKISGISTVTVYAQLWDDNTSGATTCSLKVDIGGQNSTVAATQSGTPAWYSMTIDVSGLTNTTVYDVTATLILAASGTRNIYVGNIISFGS